MEDCYIGTEFLNDIEDGDLVTIQYIKTKDRKITLNLSKIDS